VELHDYLDRATFLAFVEALVHDRETPSSPYGPGANGTIEGFLVGREFPGLPEQPSWKALYCGKIYE
jgi:hypothetical protein